MHARGAERHRALLPLLTLVWAISWPVIKVGVAEFAPIWYACLRFLIAAICLFALLLLRRELRLPARADWRLIAISGSLQMAAFSVLCNVALTQLPPGRASVLAYCTPLWVVPLAAVWLGERVSRRSLAGVVLGSIGIMAIVSPALIRGNRAPMTPYALLLAASVAWATSIVYVRGHRFQGDALALAPWQTLIAALLILPAAVFIERAPPRIPTATLLSLAYVAPVATAFAYWAVVECGRNFRASELSVALLATPAIGVVISAIVLDERISPELIAGMILIGLGIHACTSIKEPRDPP